MSNKFLSSGGDINLSNGSQTIFGATIGAVNLNPSTPIKTNSVREIISEKLDIGDINNLTDDLKIKQNLSFVKNDSQTNPDVNQIKIYAKTDGNLYKRDSDGNETGLGGGGGGLDYTAGSTIVENGLIFTDGISDTDVKNVAGFRLDTINNTLVVNDIETANQLSVDTTLTNINYFPLTNITRIDGELDVDKIKNTTHTAEIEFEDTGALTLRCDDNINITSNTGLIDIVSAADIDLQAQNIQSVADINIVLIANNDIRLVSNTAIENYANVVRFFPTTITPTSDAVEIEGQNGIIRFYDGVAGASSTIRASGNDMVLTAVNQIKCSQVPNHVNSLTNKNYVDTQIATINTTDLETKTQNISLTETDTTKTKMTQPLEIGSSTNTIVVDGENKKVVFKNGLIEKAYIQEKLDSLNIHSDNDIAISCGTDLNIGATGNLTLVGTNANIASNKINVLNFANNKNIDIDSVNNQINFKDGLTKKASIQQSSSGVGTDLILTADTLSVKKADATGDFFRVWNAGTYTSFELKDNQGTTIGRFDTIGTGGENTFNINSYFYGGVSDGKITLSGLNVINKGLTTIENFSPKTTFNGYNYNPAINKQIQILGSNNTIEFYQGPIKHGEIGILNSNDMQIISTGTNKIQGITSVELQSNNDIINNAPITTFKDLVGTKNIVIQTLDNSIKFKDDIHIKASIKENSGNLEIKTVAEGIGNIDIETLGQGQIILTTTDDNINLNSAAGITLYSNAPSQFGSISSTNTINVDAVNKKIEMKEGATSKFYIQDTLLGTMIESANNLLINNLVGDTIFNTTGQIRANGYLPTATDSLTTKAYVDSLVKKTGDKADLLALTGMVAGDQFYMNDNLGTSFTSQKNKLWTYSGRTWQVIGETVEMVCEDVMIEGNTLEVGTTADFQVKKTIATASDKCIGVIALKGNNIGEWATVATEGLWQVACEAGTYNRSSYLQTDTVDGLARITTSVTEQPFAKIVENKTTALNGSLIWALLHTQEIY